MVDIFKLLLTDGVDRRMLLDSVFQTSAERFHCLDIEAPALFNGIIVLLLTDREHVAKSIYLRICLNRLWKALLEIVMVD